MTVFCIDVVVEPKNKKALIEAQKRILKAIKDIKGLEVIDEGERGQVSIWKMVG